MSSKESVKVYVRFRPLNRLEIEEFGESEETCVVHYKDERNIAVEDFNRTDMKSGKPIMAPFAFDRIYGEKSTQTLIFKEIGEPIVDNVLAGYNGCLFAYGQTGSGKTFSMSGESNDVSNSLTGLIPRILHKLSDKLWFSAEMSEWDTECLLAYIEIYNGQVVDLMTTKYCVLRSLPKSREHPTGLLIQGLTEIPVSSFEELIGAVEMGAKNRKVSGTRMNATSSRSHALLRITIKSKNLTTDTQRTAELWLVDLAGSEKAKKTESAGERFKEGVAINTSLTFLGSCIKQLAKGKRPHFRENPLTRLLENALTGNCKTGLLLAASPSRYNLDETLSTLRFGQRAKSIKVKVSANNVLSAAKYESIVMSIARCFLKSELLICSRLMSKAQTSLAKAGKSDTVSVAGGKSMLEFASGVESRIKKQKESAEAMALKSGMDDLWKRAALHMEESTDISIGGGVALATHKASHPLAAVKASVGGLEPIEETKRLSTDVPVAGDDYIGTAPQSELAVDSRHKAHASSMEMLSASGGALLGGSVEMRMLAAESEFHRKRLQQLQLQTSEESSAMKRDVVENEKRESEMRHVLQTIKQAWHSHKQTQGHAVDAFAPSTGHLSEPSLAVDLEPRALAELRAEAAALNSRRSEFMSSLGFSELKKAKVKAKAKGGKGKAVTDTKRLTDEFLLQMECNASRTKAARIWARIEAMKEAHNASEERRKQQWAAEAKEGDYSAFVAQLLGAQKESDVAIGSGMVGIQRTANLLRKLREKKAAQKQRLKQLTEAAAELQSQFCAAQYNGHVLKRVVLLTAIQVSTMNLVMAMQTAIAQAQSRQKTRTVATLTSAALRAAEPQSAKSSPFDRVLADVGKVTATASASLAADPSAFNMSQLNDILQQEGVAPETDPEIAFPLTSVSTRRLSAAH